MSYSFVMFCHRDVVNEHLTVSTQTASCGLGLSQPLDLSFIDLSITVDDTAGLNSVVQKPVEPQTAE